MVLVPALDVSLILLAICLISLGLSFITYENVLCHPEELLRRGLDTQVQGIPFYL